MHLGGMVIDTLEHHETFAKEINHRVLPDGSQMHLREMRFYDIRFEEKALPYVEKMFRDRESHKFYEGNYFKWGIVEFFFLIVRRMFGLKKANLKRGEELCRPDGTERLKTNFLQIGLVEDHHLKMPNGKVKEGI